MLEFPIYALIGFGNAVMLTVGLAAFIRQRRDFQRVLNEIKLQSARDHYSISAEARREHAYRVFYLLYKQGEMYRQATSELRWEWDREVQKAMRETCNEETINIYLLNTGRIQSGSEREAPSDFEIALNFVKQMLDRDFERNMRV